MMVDFLNVDVDVLGYYVYYCVYVCMGVNV